MPKKYSIIINFLIILLFLYGCNTKKNKKNIKEKTKIDSLIKQWDSLPLPEQEKKYDSVLQNKTDMTPAAKAKLMFDLSNIYLDTDQSKKAEEILIKLIPIYTRLKNKEMLGKVYINLAIAYGDLEKKDQQLSAINKGIEIAKEIHSERLESRAYSEMSRIFYISGDYNKSLQFLKHVLKLQQKQKDSLGIAASYQNMAVISAENNNNDQAIKYLLKALEINNQINDIPGKAIIYNNLGALYLDNKPNFKKAIDYLNKAIVLKKKFGIPIDDEYHNLAKVYFLQKDYKKAEKYYWLAYRNSKPSKDKKTIIQSLLKLAMKEKDLKKIARMHQMEDSILVLMEKEKSKEQVRLLEKNYKLNLEKIKLSTKNKELKKNLYLYWLGVLLLLFVGIMFSLIYINKSLKLQKEKLVLEQKLLRAQLKPHFIFNSLAALQKTLIFDSPMKAITYLSKFANLIRKNFDFINKGEITLEDEIMLLKDYAEMQKVRMEKNFELVFDIDAKIDTKKTTIPPLLLQPLVENSIEHGFSKITYTGKIIIKIFIQKNKLCFEIKDNGIMKRNNSNEKREHALEILKKRLDFFNKKTLSNFKIISNPEGTRVSFCIDKKYN